MGVCIVLNDLLVKLRGEIPVPQEIPKKIPSSRINFHSPRQNEIISPHRPKIGEEGHYVRLGRILTWIAGHHVEMLDVSKSAFGIFIL